MSRRRHPNAQFGSRLRELRLKAGMSQEELAHRSGIDRTFVGRMERGERGVSLETLVKLGRVLGISASELIQGIQ